MDSCSHGLFLFPRKRDFPSRRRLAVRPGGVNTGNFPPPALHSQKYFTGYGQQGRHSILTYTLTHMDEVTLLPGVKPHTARLLQEGSSKSCPLLPVFRASSGPASPLGTVLLCPKADFDPHCRVLAAHTTALSLDHTQEHHQKINAAKFPLAAFQGSVHHVRRLLCGPLF